MRLADLYRGVDKSDLVKSTARAKIVCDDGTNTYSVKDTFIPDLNAQHLQTAVKKGAHLFCAAKEKGNPVSKSEEWKGRGALTLLSNALGLDVPETESEPPEETNRKPRKPRRKPESAEVENNGEPQTETVGAAS